MFQIAFLHIFVKILIYPQLQTMEVYHDNKTEMLYDGVNQEKNVSDKKSLLSRIEEQKEYNDARSSATHV